tara:strand:- start:86 stop:244 length:159 start_codon:yes stop_codon:yes gene_type:complete
MEKIFILTSSFANFSKVPLELLEDKNIQLFLNDKGRKLKKNETLNILKNMML